MTSLPSVTALGVQSAAPLNCAPNFLNSVSSKTGTFSANPTAVSSASVKHVAFVPFRIESPLGFLHANSATGPWQSAATGLSAASVSSITRVNVALFKKSTHVP